LPVATFFLATITFVAFPAGGAPRRELSPPPGQTKPRIISAAPLWCATVEPYVME